MGEARGIPQDTYALQLDAHRIGQAARLLTAASLDALCSGFVSGEYCLPDCVSSHHRTTAERRAVVLPVLLGLVTTPRHHAITAAARPARPAVRCEGETNHHRGDLSSLGWAGSLGPGGRLVGREGNMEESRWSGPEAFRPVPAACCCRDPRQASTWLGSLHTVPGSLFSLVQSSAAFTNTKLGHACDLREESSGQSLVHEMELGHLTSRPPTERLITYGSFIYLPISRCYIYILRAYVIIRKVISHVMNAGI